MLRPLSMCEKTAQEVQEHAVGQTKVKKSCSVGVVTPRRARCTTRCRLRSPSPHQHSTLRTVLGGLADVVTAPLPLECARQGHCEQVFDLCRGTRTYTGLLNIVLDFPGST